MSNERDELADVIGTVTDNWDEPLDPVHDIPQIVNAILAAGYRRPSTVTTAAELDALPKRSVIRDADGDAWQRFGDEWCCTDPGMDPFTSEAVAADYLPATVLHEPAA